MTLRRFFSRILTQHQYLILQKIYIYVRISFSGCFYINDNPRLGLSHLNEHRFNHNFENCLNLLCTCILEVESTTHFFLHCRDFNAIRITINNSLKAIDKDILKLSYSFLTKVILYGDSKYSDIQNHDTVNLTINYILDSKHFDCSLI